MKKKLLSLAMLTIAFGAVSAQQSKDKIIKILEERSQKQIEVYNKIYGNASDSLKKSGLIDFDKVAAVGDDFIYFNREFDNRGNIGSNIEALQNGQISSFSLNGENMELAIFDGGRINSEHLEFLDLTNPSTNRTFDLENGAQNLSTHATAVAGLIAASGEYDLSGGGVHYPSGAKGVLPKAKISSAGFATVREKNVFMKILEFGKFLSNHSYGVNVGWNYLGGGVYRYNTDVSNFTSPSNTAYGAYMDEDYLYDLITNIFPKYTIVKAAGNEYGDGPSQDILEGLNPVLTKSSGRIFTANDIIPEDNCQFGAYCISTGSLAKNILVVGSVNISRNTNFKFNGAESIIHSNYSSAGPRKDGAIKPDLVAVGTLVIVPSYTEDDLTGAYSMGSGTSYASPIVAGTVGAITQLKRLLTGDTNFYFFSDEVRAFLLHTTQEAGGFEGPDNKFGWGMLDAKKAAEIVLAAHNNEVIYERTQKEDLINNEKLVKAISGQPLKVTISWNDPANLFLSNADDKISYTGSLLTNDLDLRVIDTVTNEVYFPWKLDLANVTGAAIKGDNTVDNIEQILINEPVANRIYKIVVSSKGTLINDDLAPAPQAYTLLATGATPTNLATTDVVNSKSEVLVYPTIVKDIVNVKSTARIQKVDVIDITGKLVFTTKADKVDVSSLPIGVYIVNITTEEGVTTKKIVKQ